MVVVVATHESFYLLTIVTHHQEIHDLLVEKVDTVQPLLCTILLHLGGSCGPHILAN